MATDKQPALNRARNGDSTTSCAGFRMRVTPYGDGNFRWRVVFDSPMQYSGDTTTLVAGQLAAEARVREAIDDQIQYLTDERKRLGE